NGRNSLGRHYPDEPFEGPSGRSIALRGAIWQAISGSWEVDSSAKAADAGRHGGSCPPFAVAGRPADPPRPCDVGGGGPGWVSIAPRRLGGVRRSDRGGAGTARVAPPPRPSGTPGSARGRRPSPRSSPPSPADSSGTSPRSPSATPSCAGS